MDQNSPISRQVSLLVRTLPVIAEHDCFALKGGTAINLFVRDLPRLSVDIDLAYLPVDDRETSLYDIDRVLQEIKVALESRLGARVDTKRLNGTDSIIGLMVTHNADRIKIEVTPVLRGCVYASSVRPVSAEVENYFGYAEMQVLSFEDLYGGKLCAALDRQHPRDLFDVKLLLDNEGISADLINVFLVYLIAHSRPISELIDPNLKDITSSYQSEFEGMSIMPVTLAELVQTRLHLIAAIQTVLTEDHKRFLLSFKSLTPQWDLLGLKQASKLPAVQWKLQNLARMSAEKHLESISKLEKILFS